MHTVFILRCRICQLNFHPLLTICPCFAFCFLNFFCEFSHVLEHFENHLPRTPKQNYNVCNDMSTYFLPPMKVSFRNTLFEKIQDDSVWFTVIMLFILVGRRLLASLPTRKWRSWLLFWLGMFNIICCITYRNELKWY